MAFAPLYNETVIKKNFSDIGFTTLQRKLADKWVDKIKNKELKKEVENYDLFKEIILIGILGYPADEIKFEVKDVEFSVTDVDEITHVVFEAKGTKTKDLFARQNYGKKEQEHPVIQTVSNMQRFAPPAAYGVCTNYNDFVLLDRNLGITKCHRFTFTDIKNNPEKLKEFIGIFSYEELVKQKSLESLYEKSLTVEREFTNEFYKLFHETRLMIIKAFKEKSNVSYTEASYYTQIFLDRILFLFFALDKKLIPEKNLFVNRVLNQLKLEQCTKHSKKIFDDINLLFTALNEGDETLEIFGFNGKLFSGKIPEKVHFLDFQNKEFFANEFQNSKLSKTPKLHETYQKIFKKYENQVNPIIHNLLILDSFDFNSQINVTILGHILEQSIDDLNQFQKSGNVKRKIHGVYYTPNTITDYICKNTIIPFLSKNNSNTIHDLIFEYKNNIDELKEKIKNIKIIDPACGSGAFLINASEILLEINKEINQIIGAKQTQMTEWVYGKEISSIIQNNIFGVDINPESVEITKLSLFLKMATIGEKLTDLSKNIVNGNSLIDDREIHPSAFEWNEKFPNVMESGGFDIVIGNPPWQEVQPNIDEFFAPLNKMQILLASRDPHKTQQFSLLPKRTKLELIEKCLLDPEIEIRHEKYIEEYHKQKNYFIDRKNYQFQVSKIRGKTVSGIGINLYKLFVERANSILKKSGLIGFVLPSGIYTHAGATRLRQLLLEKYDICEFIGFHNTKGIFQDVHRQEKFCTIICKKGGPTKKFLASFYVIDDTKLVNFRDIAFEYHVDFLKKVSPDQLSFLECKNKLQLQIFQKLHKFPFLHSSDWNLKSSREFNMSDDAELFNQTKKGFPLFKGEMIHMFTDSFAPPRFWIDKKLGVDELIRKESGRIRKFTKLEITPQIHLNDYRLVWRKLTNPTNTRTLISTILHPNVFLADSLYYVHPVVFDGKDYKQQFSYQETLFVCGMCNSFVLDYILRNKIEANLTIIHFLDLPIPRFDKKNPLHQKIFKNSTMLICTSKEYEKLQKSVGISEHVTEPSKRLVLEAQINACAAQIYNLTKGELEYILEMFNSVDENLKKMTLDEFSSFDHS